ncbi:MFS transporter [Burkholderia multivorans]|uniref:MFS transporter n=1 Tax=Burkholderia multivorans TaxID=87883 RepID=UPI0013DF6C10|nr:MFS transporter [Burkholderia multivorans]MBU9616232.1 MFS transporter [Burkholderia multivorans]NGM76851.1 MFS transporter [Burkholderia multivorans]
MTAAAPPLHAATMRRLNLRLIPFLMLLYLVAYIDRSNISVAALQMNADLGLSAEMYGLGAGLFYVTYILFEVPSNLLLARVGARRWIARIMITWGVIAAGMSAVHTPGQLYAMRLLLGAAEAGFTPGIIYYLSAWYPASDRARAMSFFYIGATLASVIGLPLSGALLNLNGVLGVEGWRWLFLLEGVPALLLGIVVLRRLPDTPADARWLPADERAWLEATLRDTAPREHLSHGAALRRAFGDRNVWALAAFWLLQAFGTIGLTLFLPLLVKSLSGQSSFAVGSLSALPFLFACVAMYVNGRHSDLGGERVLHLGVPMLLAGALLVGAIYVHVLPVAYALLVLAVGFNWAATPVFWAVTTEYVSGLTAAASIALINAVANIAGLALPPVMGRIKDVTHSYDLALLLVAVALLVGGVLGLRIASRRRAVPMAARQAG